MNATEFTEALKELDYNLSRAAHELDVRLETVYRWTQGRKKIPDHYQNILKKRLRARRELAENTEGRI